MGPECCYHLVVHWLQVILNGMETTFMLSTRSPMLTGWPDALSNTHTALFSILCSLQYSLMTGQKNATQSWNWPKFEMLNSMWCYSRQKTI
jgi:hypothetical protein